MYHTQLFVYFFELIIYICRSTHPCRNETLELFFLVHIDDIEQWLVLQQKDSSWVIQNKSGYNFLGG